MQGELVQLIEATDERADTSLARAVEGWSLDRLLVEIEALEAFRAATPNLYFRVRAHAFLHHLYRFALEEAGGVVGERGTGIPELAWRALLSRDFDAALTGFRRAWKERPGTLGIASALAKTHAAFGLQALADQVKRSVRAREENAWMYEHQDAARHPLALHSHLLATPAPTLREATPVRMDLSHSGWSDIFFLAMDFPRGARVLNVSIDLALRGSGDPPRPPVQAMLRVIDEPVLRLASVDLGAEATLTRVSDVFDFACDHLGLLRAAVVAAGVVPVGLEGQDAPLAPLLASLVGSGRGLELTSSVLGIPKGSRLAVSTNLLAALIAVQMRATGQTENLTGPLTDSERAQVQARAILGEWLGGSGGGWQDSGGLWPSAKILRGTPANPGDPEFGASRGRLLPHTEVLDEEAFSARTQAKLAASLVLVHGGLAQNVGPVLEQVTESYLLRDEVAWEARRASIKCFNDIRAALFAGNIERLGKRTEEHFFGPLTSIVPMATNDFTERLIESVRARFGRSFYGFWMLGGMAGGGMGFFFAPEVRGAGAEFLSQEMPRLADELGRGTPFAITPVVYEFAINRLGSFAELVEHVEAAAATPPPLVEDDPDDEALDRLLAENGFDRQAHEALAESLAAGDIGAHANQLPASTRLEDVLEGDLLPRPTDRDREVGIAALREGRVGVVTLAGGSASRWSGGANVVKALYPFAKLGGRHRTFLDAHLAKTRRTERLFGTRPPHVFTTSFRTHAGLASASVDGLTLSPGRWIGLRLVPTERELLAQWEGRAEQALDERAEKVRASLRQAWRRWAVEAGEATDYRSNTPGQCVYPMGHGLEIPSLLVNGTLARLFDRRPGLSTLFLHNIDTLGADLDPGLLGQHLDSPAALTVEVTHRCLGDSGGSLARVDGRPRLVETLSLRDEAEELGLRYYNTLSTWIDVDCLLRSFGLERGDLRDDARVLEAARAWVARLPSYVTLKEVQRRWGRGQADSFPVIQIEKLWGDATTFDELPTQFAAVDRRRGMQLKEPGDLDDWRRSGAEAAFDALF